MKDIDAKSLLERAKLTIEILVDNMVQPVVPNKKFFKQYEKQLNSATMVQVLMRAE
jgi:hypothetical protein